jgi:hypothetical protein
LKIAVLKVHTCSCVVWVKKINTSIKDGGEWRWEMDGRVKRLRNNRAGVGGNGVKALTKGG